MKWTITIMMLALALMISAPVALADDCGCDPDCCDGCGDGCCDPGCGGLVADIELTLLRYFQEGGVTDPIGAPAEYDYEFAPRFVLGYVGPGGLGIRTRYWEIDGSATSEAGLPVGVNAYNIDIEAFQEYCLGCNTTIELSLGVRYAELWQDAVDIRLQSLAITGFSGFGGTMAAEVNRAVFVGDIYARARLSVLMGDAVVRQIDPAGFALSSYADDCTATQTELGLGYEICRCTNFGMLTLRAGVEWQNWANMAVAGNFATPADVMEDAGFAGFVFGLGLER
jgi:hypothetical protein